MSVSAVLRAAASSARRVRVSLVPSASYTPVASIHTSRPRAQEAAAAETALPSNVILDARAQEVLRTVEDTLDDPIARLTGHSGAEELTFDDLDTGARKLLIRLGDVGARPIQDLVAERKVFDIMATAFPPLSRTHSVSLPAPDGSESADAVAEPEPADAVSTVTLNPAVWDEPMRVDLLHRVVRWQLSKRRTTAYRAKTYNEKSGSGRKPFRQKGTGSARQGNKRAPIQRGGLKAHGPKLRDWSHKLNKEVRRKGLRVALSAKLRDDKVSFITGVEAFASAKTADLQRRLHAAVEGHKLAVAQDEAEATAAGETETSPAYGVAGSALVVVDPSELTAQVQAASGSLNHMVLVPQLGCTVYDVLRADRLILTTKALEALEARLTR